MKNQTHPIEGVVSDRDEGLAERLAALPIVAGEDCNCDWMGEVESVQKCPGCGTDVRLYRDAVRHWTGPSPDSSGRFHYHFTCAYRASVLDAASQPVQEQGEGRDEEWLAGYQLGLAHGRRERESSAGEPA